MSEAFPYVGPRFWTGFWLGILAGSIMVGALMTAMLVIAARTPI